MLLKADVPAVTLHGGDLPQGMLQEDSAQDMMLVRILH